ncbi:coiled-coil-helix-coiled-coil-helix domain-containing protein 7 isoform X1 [Pseudopipra pipra]|uniref:coiled-coil-helix-coiled-coil-helix domain-containing protein 7 isoform X1 n=1 Tax=Pseudopipra pipra TaxID=415032 RepID=UPI003138830E
MSRHAQKLRDHDINPCVAETDATTKCLDENNYKKDMCTAYFLKYKNCRKFWVQVVSVCVAGRLKQMHIKALNSSKFTLLGCVFLQYLMFPSQFESDISGNKFSFKRRK